LYEPFGIVALEAMAAKTPVIAADVGGLSDIVRHEYNGLTTLPNDVQSLSTQIRRLLRDREFGRKLAHVAEQNLSRFDWRNIAEKTIENYERLLT
jgi:1,4-alpha-glucan branching enzyme